MLVTRVLHIAVTGLSGFMIVESCLLNKMDLFVDRLGVGISRMHLTDGIFTFV